MNRTVIKDCHRETFHAAHTAAFNIQIFQHSLFPSEASTQGWSTATSPPNVQPLINIGNSCMLIWTSANQSRTPWNELDLSKRG